MNIGIHGKKFGKGQREVVFSVFELLKKGGIDVYVTDKFKKILSSHKFNLGLPSFPVEENSPDLNAIITLGGDGTLLEAVSLIGSQEIPILGINLGRLGFLATTAKEEIKDAIKSIINGDFVLESRTLLSLVSNKSIFKDQAFALNDFTILKKDTSSMITVHAYIDGEFLNSYWADGLIVSTPTGSTGYSLSCGGPLIMPESSSFVITPVSPHNLTTRPMVVPDTCELSFKIEGRSKNFLISMDSRFETVDKNIEIKIKKAQHHVKLIKLDNISYFKTIRHKLNWGADIRN